jgi:hypothetical protein
MHCCWWCRAGVKGVIQGNVSLLTAKIESQMDLTTKVMENKLDWAVVGNGKKKAQWLVMVRRRQPLNQ